MKITADEIRNFVQLSKDCTARRFAIEAMDYIERFKLLPIIYEKNNPYYIKVNIKDIFCNVFTRDAEKYVKGKIYWANCVKSSDRDVFMSENEFERLIDNIKKNPNVVDGYKKEMLKALYTIIKARGFEVTRQRTGIYIKGADDNGASLDWIDYDGTIKITWKKQDE